MIVVDTSVAVKWFVDEDGHANALRLFDFGVDLCAPDLMFLELANINRKKQKSGEISAQQGEVGANLVARSIDHTASSLSLLPEAVELARKLDHPIYDCIFLAAALVHGPLITADLKFAMKCAEQGFERNVFRLDRISRDFFGAAFAAHRLARMNLPELERLAQIVRDTAQMVLDLGQTGDEPAAWTQALHLLVDSPAYRRLRAHLQALSRDELAILVVVAWLGRGSFGFDQLMNNHRNALQLVGEGFGHHESYLMSQMRHLEAGLKRIEAELATSASKE